MNKTLMWKTMKTILLMMRIDKDFDSNRVNKSFKGFFFELIHHDSFIEMFVCCLCVF